MPVQNEDGSIALVFSGEDFTDLGEIRKLKERGHSFDLKDASYLVHLYEEAGDAFFTLLNGRFHGLVLDLRSRKAVLFNDRFGLNRIYYHENEKGLFFASEAKALLSILPELRRLDNRGLAEMFSAGCALDNRTLFSGISLLPGGSAWLVEPGALVKKNSYFRPRDWEEQEPLEPDEYYENLKRTWIRILPRYLHDTEPVAISLTGGKDSRMIMAWSGAPSGTLPCYTFGGMYRECADLKLARTVAGICGQPYQTITLGQEFLKEFPRWAERTVDISDGAMDVSGAADLYVNRIARGIAPIRVTGNYGQELLRGAIAMKPEPQEKRIFDQEFHALMDVTKITYQQSLTRNPLSFAAFKQLSWFHYCRLSLELSQLTLRSPYLDNELVGLAFRAPRTTATTVEMQMRLIAEGNPALGKLGTDRAVSYKRVPFLTSARRLFQEFTFKAEYAYDYGMPDWLARLDRAAKPLHMERLFLGRHKFHHFRIWYRDELAEYLKGVLLDPRAKKRPYVNGADLEKAVLSHIKGTANYTSELHRLLTAELLQRQMID